MRYLAPVPGSGDAGQQVLHRNDEIHAEGLINLPNYVFDEEIRKINASLTHLRNQLLLLDALVQFAYDDTANGDQLTAVTMPDYSKKVDNKSNVATYSQDISEASTSSSFDSETNCNAN